LLKGWNTKILSIHDGHQASVAYFNHGALIDCISEERINRLKGFAGFPKHSITWILDQHKLNFDDIDYFVFPTIFSQLTDMDMNSKTTLSLLRTLASSGMIPASIMRTNLAKGIYGKLSSLNRRKIIKKELVDKHKIPINKISFYDHHLCHAATGYYFSGVSDGIIFTLDGAGDGNSGSIFTLNKGTFKLILEVPAIDTVGGFYSGITQLLGMKRLEHEYKLMGMAPYADVESKWVKEIIEIFHNYIKLTEDGLSFINPKGLWKDALVKYLHKDLYQRRFDHICAAAQAHVENLIVTWVHNWVEKTKIRTAIFSGGVFMNVKVNQLLNDGSFLEKKYFVPSCGDNSNVIGAATLKLLELGRPSQKLNQLLYLGPSYSNDQVLQALKKNNGKINWNFIPDMEKKIAELMANDKIVARLNGRMEFGERALGNRSILCNPMNINNIRKINKAIKMRDFWMPFAVSILHEYSSDYLKGNNITDAIYMIMAFHTTEKAQKEIIAGLHPFDLTCRPQIVKKEDNQKYHKIIEEFYNITGIPALLNTSFNIHGSPIVCSPDDAIYTLMNSDLDYVAIENFLVQKD